MFVIQMQKGVCDKRWVTIGNRYRTAAEAKAAFAEIPMPFRLAYRVAEEYTVTRYRPVK